MKPPRFTPAVVQSLKSFAKDMAKEKGRGAVIYPTKRADEPQCMLYVPLERIEIAAIRMQIDMTAITDLVENYDPETEIVIWFSPSSDSWMYCGAFERLSEEFEEAAV